MAVTESHTENLRMYLNDMVALEKHIEDAIDRQREDERVKADAATADLVERMHTILRAHVLTMENHAAAYQSETGAAVKEAITSIAGVFAGLYDKVRKHPVSRLLRDDYTALSLTCTAYSMLHTTALALRELPLANVALRHLKELTPLVMDLSRQIPAAVVQELAADDPNIDATVVELARNNTIEAWSTHK